MHSKIGAKKEGVTATPPQKKASKSNASWKKKREKRRIKTKTTALQATVEEDVGVVAV